MRKFSVLCLDLEGGYGGSSRSLYELIRGMNRDAVSVEVWCKRAGSIQDRYAEIGIATHVWPEMPKMSSLPRVSRNLWQLAKLLCALPGARAGLARLVERARQCDVIHLNHEGLFLLGLWLNWRTKTPISTHFRTMVARTGFSRWQARSLFRISGRQAFITENERDLWCELAGRQPGDALAGCVIYNPASLLTEKPAPHPAITGEGRFRIACLSNYAWIRGTDRLIEVAEAAAAAGRGDLLFVVAGDMTLKGRLPGQLGDISDRNGTLADYAALRGVAGMFLFLGHVAKPETVLAACHILIKPTRENNPWGRDILEGLAAGLPVLSVGRYDRFVQTGVTGILHDRYDPVLVARALINLAEEPERVKRMGIAAQKRAADLCDPAAQADKLLTMWRSFYE